MLKIAEIFQNHMVLQREKTCYIWGTAYQGEKVTVEFCGKKVSGWADQDGRWKVAFPALSASEGSELVILSGKTKISLEDVAVGEVWIAGGQSNMEFYMRYEKHIKEEKKICTNSNLRMFDVPEVSYVGQNVEFDYSQMGFWRKADRENLEYFSAVAYYFGKKLGKEFNIPVGIIGCNWGGTSAAAWMSKTSAEKYAKPWIQECQKKFFGINMDEYWEKQKDNFLNDRGRPFEDAFSELVLPRTVNQEEVDHFFSEMNPEDAEQLQLPKPQSIPGCLYEQMITAIAPYTVRGVLWYQGESEDGFENNCQEYYGQLLKAVIQDWRELWKDPEMPFLVVQLPGWEEWIGMKAKRFDVIRKCQQDVTDTDSRAWLCSISDAGERYDVHPKNKKVVGYRLALLALGKVYGRDILCEAPRAEKIERNGSELMISFQNARGGLIIKGEQMNALSVIADGKPVSFSVKIRDHVLCLYAEDFKEAHRVKVDFAQTQWYQVNLYNEAEIPAVPFSFEC